MLFSRRSFIFAEVGPSAPAVCVRREVAVGHGGRQALRAHVVHGDHQQLELERAVAVVLPVLLHQLQAAAPAAQVPLARLQILRRHCGSKQVGYTRLHTVTQRRDG